MAREKDLIDLLIDALNDGVPGINFDRDVLDALALLTHDPAVPYMDYVAKIKENPIAKAVKLADLQHNSDLSRLNTVTDKDRQRVEKYKAATALLLD